MAVLRVIGAALAFALAIPLASECAPVDLQGAGTVSLAAPPAEPLLPTERPSGLYVESALSRDVPRPGTIAASPPGTQATVYGPRPGAPLTAPMVAALVFYGEDTAAGRPIDVGGDDARMGRTGEIAWIAWRIGYDERSDTALYEGVMGRKVSDAQIRKAAEEFDGDGGLRARVTIGPAGVPAGMRRLYSGRLPTGKVGPGFAGGTAVTWSDQRREVSLDLTEVRLDPRTDATARVLAPEFTLPVRGGTAAAGRNMPPRPPYLGEEEYPYRRLMWREGPVIVQVDASGVPDDVLTRLTASLRRGDAARLRELRRSITGYPPDRLRDKGAGPCPQVARGRTVQAGWGLCVEESGRGQTVLTADGLDAQGGYLYVPPFTFPDARTHDLEVRAQPAKRVTGPHRDMRLRIYAGRVSADVHRVRYAPAGVPPTTLDLGPEVAGSRWFTLAIPAGAHPGHLRAYDRHGERVESVRVP